MKDTKGPVAFLLQGTGDFRCFVLFQWLLLLALCQRTAFAADEVSFIAAQNALVEHGYLEVNPDRYESPQMTAAIEDFSKDYGGSPTVAGVLSTMMGLAIENRIEVADQSLFAKVEKAVGEQLRAPDSARSC